MNKDNLVASVLLGMLSLVMLASCCIQGSSPVKNVHKGSFEGSSNVTGIYHGLLPCASCPGIDTWVELSENEEGIQFRMVENYLEEKDSLFTYRGNATWIKKGRILQLQRNDSRMNYWVGENYISLTGDSSKDTEENSDYRLYRMPGFFGE